MSQNSLHEKFLNVWTVAHKFSGGNSKITKKIENYIRDNFLNDTFSYQTTAGEIKVLPVFELAEPRNGKQTPYFNPLALDSFAKQRGEELKQKAIEFENECPTISLRMLRRKLNMPPSKEQDLLKFIETKCLHDTFMKQDETGALSEELIFDYPMDSHSKTYLCIQKEGIIPFIKAHQEELSLLGAKNIQALIDQIPAFKKEENLLQQGDLFKALHIQNQHRSAFNALFFNHLIHQKRPLSEDKSSCNNPLFLKRKSRHKTIYCLKQEDMPLLLKQNEAELKAIGITKATFDHFLNNQTITKKTEDMITFSEFARQFLHSNILTPLLKEIRQFHLNDTYVSQDETGALTQKPIFVKVGARKDDAKNYVFANKEALLAFVKNNKDLLLKHGVSLFQYENIFKEQEKMMPEKDIIPVHDLSEKYHFFGREHFAKIPAFANETFSFINEEGQQEEKPLIFMQRQASGHLRYFIHKDAILTLLTRHQKELKVQNTTLKAILRNKPILIRTDTMLSMENLAEFLGKPRHLYPKIQNFIEKSCQDDKYLNLETNQEEDSFVYAMSQSGKISLMIEAKAIKNFIATHAFELAELGFSSKDLREAYSKADLTPNFHQEFVHKRRIRQDQFNERARMQQNHTKE